MKNSPPCKLCHRRQRLQAHPRAVKPPERGGGFSRERSFSSGQDDPGGFAEDGCQLLAIGIGLLRDAARFRSSREIPTRQIAEIYQSSST
ncbi:hypothetical protein ZIOFF_041979 [Zingiber officinale]|uniref:Uncharacterized protein n=1 Tax=Zingiber officinale TaxID=94328 RepID=A0A8J5L6D9_ZINOF|nr:hypothetical protein ZIOFF_041979 [Zingiber officinale]